MGLEGKPGEGGDRLHAVIVPNFDVLRQRKIVNAKEVIRFDIEGLVAADRLHQAHWQLRNLAGRSAPHHHAQDQTLRSREAGEGESGEESSPTIPNCRRKSR